jgi:hypothetical protein
MTQIRTLSDNGIFAETNIIGIGDARIFVIDEVTVLSFTDEAYIVGSDRTFDRLYDNINNNKYKREVNAFGQKVYTLDENTGLILKISKDGTSQLVFNAL